MDSQGKPILKELYQVMSYILEFRQTVNMFVIPREGQITSNEEDSDVEMATEHQIG